MDDISKYINKLC